MPGAHQPLFENAFLRSTWMKDFAAFKDSPESALLFTRLKNWAGKDRQKETAAEAALIDLFFKQTWDYRASGEGEKIEGYTLHQQFPVKGAGQKGGVGKADIALGFFGRNDMEGIPQVLGEFKDDRSGLDKPQSGRPNDRSPVDQCLDYLREARTGLVSPILPTWGLVTDMNEFRLYCHGNKTQYQRFVIQPAEGDPTLSLLGENDEALFQRFLFYRMFHSEWLLSAGGKSNLEKLLGGQIIHERTLENEFYSEYHAFRETIYQALRRHNPSDEEGGPRRLVKLTQRILDRCLFILYCEDMGRELNFPPNVLRDVLIRTGDDPYYDPEATDAWGKIRQLFTSMRKGTPFGSERINRFNGGLFAEDPEMEALTIPNCVFCEKNQGQSPERLLLFPKTLLYFCAKYNFGIADNGAGRTLTLTALGRIFEQSITDLEVMEAHAEGRESLAELTKRKRDGVYYTPEWVTRYIVEETVGARLAEIRSEIGFDKFNDITAEQISAYRKDHRRDKVVGEYKNALRQYQERLDKLKVIDPACGSGAFLIQAFRYLYEQRQWIAWELERVTDSREQEIFDMHSAMRSVLSKNIYGVDINAESVEITRLALWLHTALPDHPLTALDENIRCGNSLIGHDFYSQVNIQRDLFGEEERERVNTFDWAETFPAVFMRENPGFDCVIGNPPYVKLQHFRKIQEDVAKYLLNAKREGGGPLYESTQTGNFDLYLPFIERGMDLLNKKGKMGYIAPNVWLVNEYGKGLRQKLKRTQQLERWVDFKSFQVFDEAITYTALQFFTGSPQDHIRCVFAPGGEQDITALDWGRVTDTVFYKSLPDGDSWVLMPNAERNLYAKLEKNCDCLDESCKGITVGIQTSADYIYHLERIGPNRYLHKSKDAKAPVEVEIEDEIMRPLVSGPEAKRYQSPLTTTYLLFPYEVKTGNVHLFTMEEMASRFPKACDHLRNYEQTLRNREKGKFNDNQWYRFGRNQNIDKQELSKLMVPRLVIHLFTTVDDKGAFYLDNVDVNGILVDDSADLFFIAGILNAPVANFIWRRISKPFQNDYRSANKQFIAPLPIPKASDEEKAQVAQNAKCLQELHTRRRDLLLAIDKRLDSDQCEDDNRDEGWFWAEIKPLAQIKKDAPPDLKGRELSTWAKAERESKLNAKLEAITAMLRAGVRLTVMNEFGELKLLANGVPLIDGIFVDEKDAEFITAQWRQKIRRTNVTEKFDGKRLMGLLLNLRKTANEAIKQQAVKIDTDIQTLDAEIEQAEIEMNQLTYRLYGLTEAEIRLVEA